MKTTYTTREFKIQVLREVSLPIDALMDGPQQIADFWHANIPTASWYQEDKETLVLFTINTRRRLTGFNLISIGLLDTILTHPRDVFRPAIIAGASAIILAHNHPSGDPSPSEADIKMTRDLIRAGQLLKVELLDHVIIGLATPDRLQAWVSLRELGYFF